MDLSAARRRLAQGAASAFSQQQSEDQKKLAELSVYNEQVRRIDPVLSPAIDVLKGSDMRRRLLDISAKRLDEMKLSFWQYIKADLPRRFDLPSSYPGIDVVCDLTESNKFSSVNIKPRLGSCLSWWSLAIAESCRPWNCIMMELRLEASGRWLMHGECNDDRSRDREVISNYEIQWPNISFSCLSQAQFDALYQIAQEGIVILADSLGVSVDSLNPGR